MKFANKKIDVLIPVYKPDKSFDTVISRLLNQKIKVNKIIIINTVDHKSGELKNIWNSDKILIKNIQKSEFNHGLTRNYGMTLSDADYVMCMTQDAIPADRHLIDQLIKVFENEDVIVAYAKQIPRKDCKYVERYTRAFNYPDEDIVKTRDSIDTMGIKAIFCSDVCAMYDRNKYFEIGGFRKADFNEDMLFAYDAITSGKKVYYESKASVIHSHNYSYRQQFFRNIEIGKSQKEFQDVFGSLKSENEGIRMVKNGIKYFIKNKKAYLIPDFILYSGFKFAGFKIGKM